MRLVLAVLVGWVGLALVVSVPVGRMLRQARRSLETDEGGVLAWGGPAAVRTPPVRWASLALVAAAVAAVVALPAGLAAAERAAPGSALWPVKLRLEDLRVATTRDASDAVRLQLRLAARRVEELSQMARTGALERDDQLVATITQRLAQHTTDAEEGLADLAPSAGTRGVQLIYQRNLLAQVATLAGLEDATCGDPGGAASCAQVLRAQQNSAQMLARAERSVVRSDGEWLGAAGSTGVPANGSPAPDGGTGDPRRTGSTTAPGTAEAPRSAEAPGAPAGPPPPAASAPPEEGERVAGDDSDSSAAAVAAGARTGAVAAAPGGSGLPAETAGRVQNPSPVASSTPPGLRGDQRTPQRGDVAAGSQDTAGAENFGPAVVAARTAAGAATVRRPATASPSPAPPADGQEQEPTDEQTPPTGGGRDLQQLPDRAGDSDSGASGLPAPDGPEPVIEGDRPTRSGPGDGELADAAVQTDGDPAQASG